MKQSLFLLLTSTALALVCAASATAQETTGVPGSPGATTTIDGKQLPPPDPKFGGVIKEKASESTSWWPPRIVPPKGAPNVLLIMTDDQGFGAPSTFGGVIPTPTMDRIANTGLRYTNFHSTSLCSPTRAAIITGRNHHSVGFGVVGEISTGFPGYDSIIPLEKGTIGTLARWNTPRPSLTAGQTEFTYSGELAGTPPSAAPSILNKGYTITAEVEIPEGGAEGMIVTEGGRFGGYGLFLSKGDFGVGRGKVVFLYNLLDLKRTTWEGPELEAGKHTIVFDFKPDGPGLAKGGTGVLSVDGQEVAKNTLDHTTPITFPEDETFDVGLDTRTPLALIEYRYDVPFKFTGKIDKLTFKLQPEQAAEAKP